MKLAVFILFLLFVSAQAFAFTIDSYETHATVLGNGGLSIYENMTFTLDQQYSEGYRSIRPQDFGSLSDITVQQVRVNGADVPYALQINGDNAEIVWKKTYAGKNVVELNYTISDRVQLYDDFAKVCYEHYGANWEVPAQRFESRMTLPEASRGKDMHFEVYSAKKGTARVDDLTIVIDIDNVPPENYVGGCYLFDKGAVNTSNTVSGSAYAILQNEREIYGSQTVLAPERPPAFEWCCVPAFILLALLSAAAFLDNGKKTAYPDNILPPEKEEPAVVAALLRNSYPEKDLMSATLLDLINRGIIDIVELEKAGEKSGDINRSRTILMLKRAPKLRPHEQALVDMIFSEGKEVDLDKLAADFLKVKSQESAKKLAISRSMDKFHDEMKKLLEGRKLWDATQDTETRSSIWVLMIIAAGVLLISSFGVVIDAILYYIRYGEFGTLALLAISFTGIIACAAYLTHSWTKPKAPKGFEDKFAKWRAFERALEVSRIREYPPGSAVIWGDIIVYATAIGMAKKVISHLSEMKAFEMERLYKLEKVRESSSTFFFAAVSVNNLAKYGSASGRTRGGGSYGGFSSYSSGGWSGGGGGFSGGSSGGGGFR